jgi:predicted AAA+ superfamily ATPase
MMTNKVINREIFPEIAGHLDKPEITLITGSRQVGKTVVIGQLREWLIEHKKIPESYILSLSLLIKLQN